MYTDCHLCEDGEVGHDGGGDDGAGLAAGLAHLEAAALARRGPQSQYPH